MLSEQNSAGLTTYVYDESGNRIEKNSPAETTYYTWDEDSRLVAAEPPAGVTTPVYNADGLRVGKETPSESRKFIYDFRKLLQETDGADDPQRWYTFTTEEYGDLVSQYDGADTLYHQYDGLGSTYALLDEWETATDRYAYRAFGLEAARSGTTDNPFTYVGRQSYYKDSELELYLLGARYYDPALGRFLSQDPIRFEAGDANLLRYVENGPANFMDPSGLEPPRAVRPLQQYLAARNAEVDESLWNLANPLKGSFLPWYLIGSTYHALAAAPGSVQQGFAEGQARVNVRHSKAEDTVGNRTSYAFQTAILYAGEAIAHGGVRLGQIGMAGYAAAHGGPVGPALMQYKPVQTLGLIGTGSSAVLTTVNIVVDLSQGNAPSPGDLVDLGIFGCTSLRFKQQLTTASRGGMLLRSGPIPRSLGAMSRGEALARKLKLKLNIKSPTARQVLNSLDDKVSTFVGKFRQGKILKELPTDMLDMTVEEALRHSTKVRKLLIDRRFVK